MRTLLTHMFAKHSKTKDRSKPWKEAEQKALLAEKVGDIQRALAYDEEAFLVLKVHFEPSRIEHKYYQQKQSELRFHMERLKHEQKGGLGKATG